MESRQSHAPIRIMRTLDEFDGSSRTELQEPVRDTSTRPGRTVKWPTGIQAAPLACALFVSTLATTSTGYAQIDPEARNLLQLGFNQSLHNDGPLAAYAFYYWNQPDVPTTNMTLRLALAPVYADAELGFKGLLGQNTDLAVGVFGGRYYNSYYEVGQGNYYRDESFDGHGGGATLSLYYLFNPGGTVPLNGIVRAGLNYHVFSDTSDTADNFRVPRNQPFYTLHTGLRWLPATASVLSVVTDEEDIV